MSEKPVFWDVRSDADHQEMAALLAPMIVASQNRNFIDKAAAKAQTYAWRLTLSDVPKAIVKEAIDLLVARGINWMPKPGEVKAECAAIVEKKRALIRQSALSGCTHNSQWIDGPDGLKRCPCWSVMQKQLDQVERPIALPPMRQEVEA